MTKPVKLLIAAGAAFAIYELYSAMSAPPAIAAAPPPAPPPNVTFAPGAVLPTNATLGSLSGNCFGGG